ncbi:MAG: alpha-amylase/4-alpha-glucanotransferase domain-containing protein [Verrucomicrobiae bacterium]|nr:alpha-amylase/4-alpha-glucanotransferase domain-containing protein [Verrucomicrobiae bacterium]
MSDTPGGCVNLVAGLNCQMPVGATEARLQEAFDHVYRPFVSRLVEYPHLCWNLHFSGTVLDFFYRKHPWMLAELKRLAHRGQVELIGGGFYDPVLPVIPAADAVDQVRKLRGWIENNLSLTAGGAWLTESVWEPSCAPVLAMAGAGYTFLDESLFLPAGVAEGDLFGYYAAEDQGRRIFIFPLSNPLRGLIPGRPLDQLFSYLRRLANRNENLTVCWFGEAEEFGGSTESRRYIHAEGYLEALMMRLTEHSRWVRTRRAGEVIGSEGCRGLVAVPSGAPRAMMKWSLSHEAEGNLQAAESDLNLRHDAHRFVSYFRGGSWRGFLAKYSEANLMHKTMLRLSRELHHSGHFVGKEAAYELLYQSQSHAPYWHGVSAGIYDPELRGAHWRRLAALDRSLAATHPQPRVEQVDFDCDGQDEILFQNGILSGVLNPGYGGSLSSCLLLTRALNLAGTLTRRKEHYQRHPGNVFHARGPDVRVSGREIVTGDKVLVVDDDWYSRRIFQDHFFAGDTRMGRFERCDYGEWGDFVNQPYRVLETGIADRTIRVRMEREGGLYPFHQRAAFAVQKELTLQGAGMEMAYRLENRSDRRLEFAFAVEMNLGLLCGPHDDVFCQFESEYRKLMDSFEMTGQREMRLVDLDEGLQQTLGVDEPARVWSFPIITFSRGPGGVDKHIQGISLTCVWDMTLEPGQHCKRLVRWMVKV